MLNGRLKRHVSRVTRDTIEAALTRFGWNRTKAAKWLGITPPTLRTYIRELNIKPKKA